MHLTANALYKSRKHVLAGALAQLSKMT